MREALYRKYRSKTLSEIVGQQHITDTLHRAVESGNISHAYLFTGPRGVGKTSIARILAHQVNGLPYDEHESTHLDIIEIDAASNRRIDEIRDLKERVHIAPTSATYKVYIIDEVHMLTKEAFNALLKTLEEPPKHAIFILATTELHKLPETIISRTQRFGFKPIATDDIVSHLGDIAQQENIKISQDALELIAAHGDGSFRDSISLLDQVQHIADEITQEHVASSLGLGSKQLVETVTASLHSGDLPALHAAIEDVRSLGIQAQPFSRQLAALIRDDIVTDNNNPSLALGLLRQLADVPSHTDPFTALELALYEYALAQRPAQQSTPTSPPPEPKPQSATPVKDTPPPAKKHSGNKATKSEPPEASTKNPDEVEATETASANLEAFDDNVWNSVLDEVKKKYNTLYGVIRMAEPRIGEGTVELAFSFPFHHKKLKEQKNQKILIDIIKTKTGEAVTITPVLRKKETSAPKQVEQPKKANGEEIETVSNIFGGAEVVES